MDNNRIHRNTTEAIEQALKETFEKNHYADHVIEKILKQNPKWGSHDRRFIAENTYDIIRWWRLIETATAIKEGSETRYTEMIAAWLLLKDKNLKLPEWLDVLTIPADELFANYHKAKQVRKIKESIPDWLDEMGERELGAAWEKELHAMNEQARVVLRVNTIKTNKAELKAKFIEENVLTEDLPSAKDALLLTKRMNVFQLKEFKEGLFEVQDASSQQVAEFLLAEPGMRVIDACAGAGGKSLHIAALMNNKGKVLSLDKEEKKLAVLKHRAKRNGAGIIETRTIDSTKIIKRLYDSAERLLLDVPCSGLGVLRRNPDAKWKLDTSFIESVKKMQREILQQYCKMVKVGGKLVYATCSIFPSENQEQVRAFLQNNPNEFELEEEKQIFPSSGFDGFYMARLKRVK